jgi:hypothetical protein
MWRKGVNERQMGWWEVFTFYWGAVERVLVLDCGNWQGNEVNSGVTG